MQYTRITSKKFIRKRRVVGKKYFIYDLCAEYFLTNYPADIVDRHSAKVITLVATDKHVGRKMAETLRGVLTAC